MGEYFARDPLINAAYQFALAEYGQKQWSDGHNPMVMRYLDSTFLSPVNNDDVHWCSAFVNWCITDTGLEGTDSPRARSWETWGSEVIDTPQTGDIVVLSRTSNPALGHVGFHVMGANGQVSLLGGNQDDSVNITTYSESRIVSIRTLYS